LLFSRLAGRETGELEVYLWGSDREITHGRENWKARFISRLTNSVFFNAFRIPPQKMREFVTFINTRKPKLIVAYAGSLTDLAKFIEKEGLHVEPQKAIIVSAETLLPHMRETLERVFQCKVYNRYGSREIGNIACERPGYKGLWIPPWGNYVEVLDDQGHRVPDGTEGKIVITSLVNFAMPLIRYQIDDYGALLPQEQKEPKTSAQVFKAINGRVINQIRNKEGAHVNPGFLCGLFFFNDWVKQYQIIQKDVSHIVYRIVPAGAPLPQSEQEKFIETTRLAFGSDCKVEFDFVDDIPASGSGKFHYTICEIEK